MKPHHLIAPVLALAGSGFWLKSQDDTIVELTEKNRVIKERVVLVDQATESALGSAGEKNEKKQDEFTLPDGSLDWETIAQMSAEMQNPKNMGMPSNMKAMLKLQQKMMELTEEEIISGLEKIDTLGLDEKALGTLKQGLLNQLSEKNPALALETMGDPVTSQEGTLFWTQTQILARLAKDDPVAAGVWLDRQIAEGKLQSTSLELHNDPLFRFESAIINQLVVSDYEAAGKRLSAYGDKEKMHLLTRIHPHSGKEGAEGYLKLVRENLDEEKAGTTIVNAWGNRYHENIEEMTKSVEGVPFTDGERTAVLERMAGNLAANNGSEASVKEIYEWSKIELPGKETDIATNALVGNQLTRKDPDASFQKALDLAESLGDPKIASGYVSKLSEHMNGPRLETHLSQFEDPDLAARFRSLMDSPSTEQD